MNTLKDLNFFGKLNASFFQSASARTAGFASVNIAEEHDISKLLTVLLMFIGASPASTGGGIKTTTAVVLAATVISVIRGHEDTVILKRRITKSIVYRALAIVSVALLVVLIATAVILTTNEQEISTIDALFESVSAFATVGLTAGITQELNDVSKLMLSFTMFIGRVGPVSLGLAIAGIGRKNRRSGAILPEGKVIVG